MAAPALPREIAQLREQLLRDQAPSARQRSTYFDPGVFVSRFGRPYSSRRLPLNVLDEMRSDAQLRFAQMISLVPIFTGKWRVESESARKAQFIDHALRRIIGRLILQLFESWNFGYTALVKEFALLDPGWSFVDKDAEGGPALTPVWDGGPGIPALVWDTFVPLPPRAVAPVWKADGSFNGIALAKSGVGLAYGLPTTELAPGDMIDIPIDVNSFFSNDDENQQKIDIQHALWVVNERDSQYGSIWGRSRLSYAYKYWWSYEMTLGILNRSIERKGDPTIIVSYPQGSSRVGDVDVANQDIAFQIGDRARSGSVLAVPSEVWGEETGTSNQSPKWNITYLKAEEQFDKLLSVLSYYDTMKIRSMLVAELSFAEGASGTSSRNVAATVGERSYEAQIFTQVEWDEIINRYMIPQLADANFPELRDVPARKVTQAFGEDEANLAADILRSFANADPTTLPLDLPALLERFQIDSLSGESLADWERRKITQAEQSQPPATPATPNGAAGTTDTGFYYNAPERIQLEDESLLAALPKTKHYADRAVLAQTRLVRRLYHDLLGAQYEDFARHIAAEGVELADDPEKRASRIIAAWRFTGSLAAQTVTGVASALGKIFARAGAIELASSRIKSDRWDPSDETLTGWVRDNVAASVRTIDETTRAQLRSYLATALHDGKGAGEITAGVREHFADFPDWRSDLIARTETQRFYNAATLFAAEAAGSEQVQALDAQNGPSDAECMRRNGKLFSISDAWQEADREHIRGTLGWRILPPGVQLSLQYIGEEETDGVAARVDRDERVIYLVEGLELGIEGQYLDQAISWFIATA